MDTVKNWIAAFAAAAALGAAVVFAGATVGPTVEAPTHSDTYFPNRLSE
jgi:hypothetical protein